MKMTDMIVIFVNLKKPIHQKNDYIHYILSVTVMCHVDFHFFHFSNQMIFKLFLFPISFFPLLPSFHLVHSHVQVANSSSSRIIILQKQCQIRGQRMACVNTGSIFFLPCDLRICYCGFYLPEEEEGETASFYPTSIAFQTKTRQQEIQENLHYHCLKEFRL